MNIYIEVVEQYQNLHKDNPAVWNICTSLLIEMEKAEKQMRGLRAVHSKLEAMDKALLVASDDVFQAQLVLSTSRDLLHTLRCLGFLPEAL